MKKIILLAVSLLLLQSIHAQNKPTGMTFPVGTVTNNVAYPTYYSPPSGNLYNFIRTWSATQALYSPTDFTFTTAVVSKASMATSYYNGFGQPLQDIIRNGTQGASLINIHNQRVSKDQVDFPLYPEPYGGNGKFRKFAFNEQYNFYQSIYPNEGATALAETEYTSTSAERRTSLYKSGLSAVGVKKGQNTVSKFNSANEVIDWNLNYSTYIPYYVGYYGAGDLIKTVTTTSDGNYSEVFTDKVGDIICSKILVQSDGTSNIFEETYYIYDNYKRRVFTISPKAFEKAIFNNNTFTLQIVNNLCYYEKYDAKGRIYERHDAGQNGNEYIIFDKKDRVVLSQTPLLSAQNKYSFTLYDQNDRTTVTGLYPAGTSPSDWQNYIDNKSVPNISGTLDHYIVWDQDAGTYPQSIYGAEILSYTYYDNYNFDLLNTAANNRTFDPNEFAVYPLSGIMVNGFIPTLFENTKKVYGQITAKKIKVLKPVGSNLDDWIYNIYYYDFEGQNIQTHTRNAVGDWDIVSTIHNYSGKPILTILNHNNHYCTGKSNTKYATLFDYHPTTFLLNDVKHSIDNYNWFTLADYRYNTLGQLMSKNLGGGVELQEYKYDIQGRLISINADYVNGSSTSTQKSFGESLSYDYGFDDKYINGQLSGTIWRGSGSISTSPNAYGYHYNKKGQLIAADFNKLAIPSGSGGVATWNNTIEDFSVPEIKYDINGNITDMKQMGMGMVTSNGSTSSQIVQIDNLHYDYENGDISNRIKKVTDVANTYNVGDFVDGYTGDHDYEYDDNGNLKVDQNKKISSITYNELNLPLTIQYSTGEIITYTYDASGALIRQNVNSGGSNIQYDYFGPFIYKADATSYQLNSVSHDEGRLRYHDDGNGNKIWDYDFYVKDHLGNVRNVKTAQVGNVTDHLATYEHVYANAENLIFGGLDDTRDTNPLSFDPNDQAVARLNADESDKRIGTTLLLPVAPGDKFELSTYSFYENYDSAQDNPLSAEDVMNSVVTTLMNGSNSPIGGENGNNQNLINSLFNGSNFVNQFSQIKQSVIDPTKPSSGINYILFDENMNIIPDESGIIQVGAPNSWQLLTLANQYVVTHNGYLAIFISNDSRMNTYFNQTKLRFIKGGNLDEFHYYPFGLAVRRSTNLKLVDKECLYQSNELEESIGLNWHNFHARRYDAQLGRFLSNDPLNQNFSGYIGMCNNPASITDPEGQYGGWDDLLVMGVGGAVNLGINLWEGNVDNFWQGVEYFGVGAVGAELTYLGSPLAGGAFVGAGNDAIRQANNGTSLKNWNWTSTIASAAIGAGTSELGAMVGSSISPLVAPYTSKLGGPAVSSAVTGAVAGWGTGLITSMGASLALGEDIDVAWHRGIHDANIGFVTGGASGVVFGIKTSRSLGVNPWTGKPVMNISNKLEYFFGNAKDQPGKGTHNSDRSKQNLEQLQRIGLNDDATGRASVEKSLKEAWKSKAVEIQENGRAVKYSPVHGPKGTLIFKTIWEGDRLITGWFVGKQGSQVINRNSR